MYKAVSADSMKEIDRITIEEYGVYPDILMYTAGFECFKIIKEKYSTENCFSMFCGKGNNGGDGFVISFLLHLAGYRIKSFLIGDFKKLSSESRKYYDICLKYNIIEDSPDYSSDVIIDCILGTGVKGAVREPYKSVIDKINESSAEIISIDIPSGLNSDGAVEDEICCVKADRTFTIGCYKKNIITSPGRRFCGEVLLLENIFPPEIINSFSGIYIPDKEYIFNNTDFNKKLNTHKYREGVFLIAGGFEGMEGAALLSANALFETGCGIAKVITSEKSRPIIAGKIPELMTSELTTFDKEFFEKTDAVILGPGLGRSPESEKFYLKFTELIPESIIVIVDGDALYFLKKYPNSLKKLKNIILTPHDGEALRLSEVEPSVLRNDRLAASEKIATEYNAIVLLKGSENILTNGKSSYFMDYGNESLATAGSGDILTGIIASMIKKTDSLENAVIAAVYIQGKSAQLAAEDSFNPTIRSGDIIPYIRKVCNDLSFPFI